MEREIKVFIPCSDCAGSGNALQEICPTCRGEGKTEIPDTHPEYKKYYRMTLKSRIEASIDEVIAVERHHQKSLGDYDFYVGLLRKLDMQEAGKL